MIEVQNIYFQYPGDNSQDALRGVSFTLKPGEKVALMGANGSGKTTLVRCLNGLLKPASGEVRVTTVTDLLGNVTQVAFQDVRVNTDPVPGTFRFRPPSGVRVIELEP